MTTGPSNVPAVIGLALLASCHTVPELETRTRLANEAAIGFPEEGVAEDIRADLQRLVDARLEDDHILLWRATRIAAARTWDRRWEELAACLARQFPDAEPPNDRQYSRVHGFMVASGAWRSRDGTPHDLWLELRVDTRAPDAWTRPGRVDAAFAYLEAKPDRTLDVLRDSRAYADGSAAALALALMDERPGSLVVERITLEFDLFRDRWATAWHSAVRVVTDFVDPEANARSFAGVWVDSGLEPYRDATTVRPVGSGFVRRASLAINPREFAWRRLRFPPPNPSRAIFGDPDPEPGSSRG